MCTALKMGIEIAVMRDRGSSCFRLWKSRNNSGVIGARRTTFLTQL